MRTLKYAGTLLVALAYSQASTVQAETLHHNTSIRANLSGQSTDQNWSNQNHGIILASMSQMQDWHHEKISSDTNIDTLTDTTTTIEKKPATQDIAKRALNEPVNQDKQSVDLQCLALNIYFEARGESENGKRAVGHVVMNRLEHRKFPNSVCAVVQQGGAKRLHRCQFSWWCDGRSDTPLNNKAWNDSIRIAQEIYKGDSTDPTGGALWYHADYVSPYWRTAFQKGPQIGQHIFYLASR